MLKPLAFKGAAFMVSASLSFLVGRELERTLNTARPHYYMVPIEGGAAILDLQSGTVLGCFTNVAWDASTLVCGQAQEETGSPSIELARLK